MSTDNKAILAERLTTDHNARDENIRRELKSLHPHDPDIVVPVYGTWLVKGKIQLSRSIGNVYFKRPELARDPKFIRCAGCPVLDKPVLTAEPCINVRELNQQQRFLIFASDGLWDLLTDQEAVEFVHNHWRRKGIAKRLLRVALEKAAKQHGLKYSQVQTVEKGERRAYHDDITVVVVFLDANSRKTDLDSTDSPTDIFSS